MRFHAIFAALIVSSPALTAADQPFRTLPSEEFAAGWVSLYDGSTLFGWKVEGNATVKDGNLIVGMEKPGQIVPTADFGRDCEYELELRGGRVIGGEREIDLAPTPAQGKSWGKVTIRIENGQARLSCRDINSDSHPGKMRPFQLHAEPKNPMTVHSVKARVATSKPLFNGKDLTGWKRYTGEAKRELSKFEVTKDGELHLVNGPGDLQTEADYRDFCLHCECRTNGTALNSGLFFRCLPGQYQQGYEAQIHNGFKDNDRTKPSDFGTGAIYRRIPTRAVVANDKEWFVLTVLAVGPRLRTWVNGYPTVDWVDERPVNANGRNGRKLDAGRISIQGHDATTDILFRNLRITTIGDKPSK
ncbi:MAG: DUF1080 domain-containing protein [Gemmataceae bacterium]